MLAASKSKARSVREEENANVKVLVTNRLPWEDKPYSLVSLYEMQRFHSERFLELIQDLTRTEHLCKDFKAEQQLPEDALRIFRSSIGAIEYECNTLGLQVTCAQLKAIKSRISQSCTVEELKAFLMSLRETLTAEMSTTVFLHIDPRKADYYNDASLFGSEVEDKFPSAIYDIEEAGKCLALERNTACVFHLMRIMEAGLRALGKSLNDPALDPKKNPSWDSMLRKCNTELQKKLADRCAEWKSDDTFFSQATANLLAVKNAWRNPTMHVQEKYTDEEANDIYLAVRGFMRHLATKLAE